MCDINSCQIWLDIVDYYRVNQPRVIPMSSSMSGTVWSVTGGNRTGVDNQLLHTSTCTHTNAEHRCNKRSSENF